MRWQVRSLLALPTPAARWPTSQVCGPGSRRRGGSSWLPSSPRPLRPPPSGRVASPVPPAAPAVAAVCRVSSADAASRSAGRGSAVGLGCVGDPDRPALDLRHRPALGPWPAGPTTSGRTPASPATPIWRRPWPTATSSWSGCSARRRTCAAGSSGSGRPASRWWCSGGEQTPDAALMELSTVPIGVAAQAHVYLAQGGPENLAQLHAFLSDTVLLTGVGFEPPAEQPAWGVLPRPQPAAERRSRTAAGRDPVLPGPAGRREHRVRARRWPTRSTRRAGSGVPIFATSLRDAPADLLEHLGTPRRPGHHRARRRRHRPATASAGGEQTRPGTCEPWPRWTSRSCRASA